MAESARRSRTMSPLCVFVLLLLAFGCLFTRANPQADAYAIGEAHEHYDAMLHRMDADGDGVLTKQEALDVGDDILLDDQQAGIRLDDVVSADINGDGQLERHEWIKHRSGFARKDEL